MVFRERLNLYIEQTGIRQQELASASGLGNATISRYCSGEREPKEDSSQIRQLAKGLAALAAEREVSLTEGEILLELNRTVSEGLEVDYDTFRGNLNQLLKALDIRGNELARALNYDPSHVSKILSGARRPGNIKAFIQDISLFIARRAAAAGETEGLLKITGAEPGEAENAAALQRHLISWLGSNQSVRTDKPLARFLEKLDDFDLNEYLKAIRFDEIKVPQSPFHLPTKKTYYGIQKMMESELDFMRTTVLSRSMDDCILYSDMPLQEMADDPEFPAKWMFGMGMMLRKGLHLHIIHDVNRPFPEMMYGLEGNIPMYMTGLISPYYLASSQSGVFNHLLKVSGAAALEGSAIAGKQGSGKYVLYRSAEDVKHYRRRAKDLLEKAMPLMDIYRGDRKEEFLIRRDSYWQKDDRKMICSSLPLFTMSEELLEKILEPASLSPETKEEIRAFRASSQKAAVSLLKGNSIHLKVPELTEEQYREAPLDLALTDLFIEGNVPCSYSDYLAHLEETRRFAGRFPNMTLESGSEQTFRNISITIIGDKRVIVSKEKSPAIHFVIHHKRMVQAFQNFTPPIVSR